MALLGCYLDDSRDQFDKEVFAVAGYFGWSLDFLAAETKWTDCLKTHGLKWFHAVECEHVNGEFSKLRKDPRYTTLEARKAAAAEIRKDFLHILNEAEIDGIGLGVPTATYRKVLETEPDARIFLQDQHFYFAYHQLMIELVKRVETLFRGHWIGFVCDHHSAQKQAEDAYDELKDKNPKSARVMGSISHCDDKILPALQMADLLAYEARLATVEEMKGAKTSSRPSFHRMKDSIWFINYASEQYLRDAIRDLVQQRKKREKREKRI